MTWTSPRYSSMPQNKPLTVSDVLNSPQFGPAVMGAVNNPSLRSSLVGKSVPWSAVDLPLVTALPQNPDDRAEVNLLIDATNETIVRMVYRKATGNWVQVGRPPVVTSLPTGVDGMEVNYLIDATNSIYIRMLYTGAAWVQIGKVPILTSLPAATFAGYEIIYDTGTAGVRWHLVYDASDGATYPWLFIGGPPLISVATGSTTRAVSTYGDLAAGAATTFTLALAGDYIIDVGANLQPGSAGFAMFASFSVAGATALDTDAAQGYYGATTDPGQSSVFNRAYKTGLAAGTTIQQKFKMQGASSGTVDRRFISITPVRVA